jgi:anthranilate phosphoribosyltransferase
MIDAAIRRTEAGHDLSLDEVVEAFDLIIGGRSNEEEIGRWLLAINRKGASVCEVAGAAIALRRKMTPIRSSRGNLLDTCGTGGDGLCTFNISTAAALVTAAAGVPVAKHGNRAASSRSGSADVLAALGVNVEAGVPVVERCLDELGVCFCFAPLLHEAMRHVAPVRAKLGVPTIFNIVGPLVNPAAAPRQLLGVGRPKLRMLLAEALVMLGTERSVVVHGSDGLDEVTLSGSTEVAVCGAGVGEGEKGRGGEGETGRVGAVRQFRWTPADFGLNAIALATIQVAGPDESAAMIRAILAGERGPARDIVVANAAAALWTADKAASPAAGAALAAEAIDSGAARELLARLIVLSGGGN